MNADLCWNSLWPWWWQVPQPGLLSKTNLVSGTTALYGTVLGYWPSCTCINFNLAGKMWGHRKTHANLHNQREHAVWQRYRPQPPAPSVNHKMANYSCCPRRACSEMPFLVIWWGRQDLKCLLPAYNWILGSTHNVKNYCFHIFILNICLYQALKRMNNEKFINLNRFSNGNNNIFPSVGWRDKTTTALCLDEGDYISGSILGSSKQLRYTA